MYNSVQIPPGYNYNVTVGTGINNTFRPLNNFSTLSNPMLTIDTNNSNINTGLLTNTIDSSLTTFTIDIGGIVYITNPNQSQTITLATKQVESIKYITTIPTVSKPFYIDARLATVPSFSNEFN